MPRSNRRTRRQHGGLLEWLFGKSKSPLTATAPNLPPTNLYNSQVTHQTQTANTLMKLKPNILSRVPTSEAQAYAASVTAGAAGAAGGRRGRTQRRNRRRTYRRRR